MEIRSTVFSRNKDVEFSLLLSYESMGYMQLKSVSTKGFIDRSLINVGLNSMRHTQFKKVVSQSVLFNFSNYSPSIAMELKVSKKITCNWQSQRFKTNKYVSWALFLKLQTAEINFEKLLGRAVFKNLNFNPFQFLSLLQIRDICCIRCVILTFLECFKRLFLCLSWI